MEGVTQGAAAISTYGLYAVCAALVVVIVHLYNRFNSLDGEFRIALVKQAESVTKIASDYQSLTEKTNDIIEANTAAFEEVSRLLRAERD